MHVGETLVVTIVDTETTGLDPEADELIGIELLSLEVDSQTGSVLREIERYTGWSEPEAVMSAEIEKITQVSKASLKGRRFDHDEVNAMLS